MAATVRFNFLDPVDPVLPSTVVATRVITWQPNYTPLSKPMPVHLVRQSQHQPLPKTLIRFVVLLSPMVLALLVPLLLPVDALL